MLMRGEAEILVTYDMPQSPCNVPAQLARRHVLGQDDLMLVASPALHKRLNRVPAGERVPMLCFPPDSFFGQAVRAEALPDLMRRQQVVVRCVSEFAMGLRELALVGEGAAWLPASLIRDDLARGQLLPLSRLGHSVRMDIVVFFAALLGDRADHLLQSIGALGGSAHPLVGAPLDRRTPRKLKPPPARAVRARSAR
jgi:LysR family transcriptional regulator, hypochlorite-specific transcription factor HypT